MRLQKDSPWLSFWSEHAEQLVAVRQAMRYTFASFCLNPHNRPGDDMQHFLDCFQQFTIACCAEMGNVKGVGEGKGGINMGLMGASGSKGSGFGKGPRKGGFDAAPKRNNEPEVGTNAWFAMQNTSNKRQREDDGGGYEDAKRVRRDEGDRGGYGSFNRSHDGGGGDRGGGDRGGGKWGGGGGDRGGGGKWGGGGGWNDNSGGGWGKGGGGGWGGGKGGGGGWNERGWGGGKGGGGRW